MFVQILLITVALGLLTWLMRSQAVLARVGRASAASKPLSRYPSVTVVRPIKGLDAGIKENIDAALDHGYPGEVETLFVFDDDREPALPLVRRAIDTRRGIGKVLDARILFSGEPPPGRTGKLNAMIAGFQESRGELVAFADSDIRPDRDALRVLVETLCATPRAGAASAPVVVTEKPVTLGDTGYALLLNGLYAPAAAKTVRERNGTLSFIMGQFMVLTREAIAAIGGLESATGQLVDDMYLGARIKAAGFRNVVSPQRVPIIQRGMSPEGVLAHLCALDRIFAQRAAGPGIQGALVPAASDVLVGSDSSRHRCVAGLLVDSPAQRAGSGRGYGLHHLSPSRGRRRTIDLGFNRWPPSCFYWWGRQCC